MNIFGKESDLPWLFMQEASQEGEKHTFINMHEQNVIGSQHSWTTLRMSTPLFLGSYLQASWQGFSQKAGRNTRKIHLISHTFTRKREFWTASFQCLAKSLPHGGLSAYEKEEKFASDDK